MLDHDTKRSVYGKVSVLKTNSRGSEPSSPSQLVVKPSASLRMDPLLLHPDTWRWHRTQGQGVCVALESSNSKIFGFLFLTVTECMSLVWWCATCSPNAQEGDKGKFQVQDQPELYNKTLFQRKKNFF